MLQCLLLGPTYLQINNGVFLSPGWFCYYRCWMLSCLAQVRNSEPMVLHSASRELVWWEADFMEAFSFLKGSNWRTPCSRHSICTWMLLVTPPSGKNSRRYCKERSSFSAFQLGLAFKKYKQYLGRGRGQAFITLTGFLRRWPLPKGHSSFWAALS